MDDGPARFDYLYIAPEGRDWSQNLLTNGPMVGGQHYDTGPIPKGNTQLWVSACDGRHINKEGNLYSIEGKGVTWEIFDFP